MKWEEMSRAQRRVAVAKDVIKHINAEKLIVRAATGYVRPINMGFGATTKPSDEPVKAWAKRIIEGKNCSVCARGAMMLCKVAKYNHYEPDRYDGFYYGAVACHTSESLGDCFTQRQLELIEKYFENGWCDISDPQDRLLAIMKNIVDHEGTFKPSVQYKVV